MFSVLFIIDTFPFETNRMVLKAKLYQIFFRFLTHSLLRGLKWAVLRAWTQNHPKIVGTCPGHHPQPIGRNRVFEIERPEPPPLKVCQ